MDKEKNKKNKSVIQKEYNTFLMITGRKLFYAFKWILFHGGLVINIFIGKLYLI